MTLSRRIELVYLLLAVAGIVVSAFLSSFHFSGQAAEAFCTGAGGCGTVNESTYSAVLGIPIAFLGLVAYAAIAVLALLSMRDWQYSEWVPLAVFGTSLSGSLYSIYLTYLELFVINAICPWCVASAAIMFALLCVSLADLLRLRRGPIPSPVG